MAVAVKPPALGVADMRQRAARSSKKNRMSGRARLAPPVHLPGATEFSEEQRFYSPYWMVATLKGLPWVWRELRTATRVQRGWGPQRGAGDWPLVYLAFVMSGHVDVQPWAFRVAEDAAFWSACGFETPPSYWTIWSRFAELEQFADAFAEAAGKVIRKARESEPRIGQWLHIDGTETETHAAPRHDCQPGDGCPTTRWGRKRRMPRLSADTVASVRHALSDLPEDGTGKVTGDVLPEEVTDAKADRQRGGVRFRSGGHWWFSRDADAGSRVYRAGKAGRKLKGWHGFYSQKVIDHLTGAPVTVLIHSASENEHIAYPRAMEQAMELTGLVPTAVAGDRGFSLLPIFEWNTRRGIGSVFQHRRLPGARIQDAHATDVYDEHGVPRCQHCSGEARVVRFLSEPEPRIWFRCLFPGTPKCHGVQSISCSRDWRRLLPVARTSDTYAALRAAHQNTERTHDVWRDRYRSGGKTLAERPKRIGRGCHQLRANAALLIEWVRICYRQGWLGTGGRHADVVETNGSRVSKRIKAARQRRRTIPPPQPIKLQPEVAGQLTLAVVPGKSRGRPAVGPPLDNQAPF